VLVPISGALSDRGLPRVTTNIVIACISGAAYVPTFLAFQTRSVVACWLLQALHLSLVAWAMGVLPVIVSRIYPAGVRISGFNLGHNFGEGWRASPWQLLLPDWERGLVRKCCACLSQTATAGLQAALQCLDGALAACCAYCIPSRKPLPGKCADERFACFALQVLQLVG